MVDIIKQLIILGVIAVVGIVISLPAIFALGFGVPGSCSPPNSYCYQWGALIALAVSPFYLGFIGVFFALLQNLRKYLKYLYILILLLPLTATVAVVALMNESSTPTQQVADITTNLEEEKEDQ